MAVSPNTVTFKSSYSALSHLVFLDVASVSDLPVTFPSPEVFTNLSASSGASRSGLFVFCARSHCCSCAATAFSAVSVCDHAAVTSKSKPSKHISVFFIEPSPYLFVETWWKFCQRFMADVLLHWIRKPGSMERVGDFWCRSEE